MMRRVLLFAASAGFAVVLSACPPAGDSCSSDEQCQERGEVCVNGQCQECATDANCKPGFVCQANQCVPKPECAVDQDCPAGRMCQGGRCLAAECKADADCKEGKCREGLCVKGACNSTADCKSGEECREGMCAAPLASACDFSAVRFGFNEATLEAEAQSRLAQVAECLKKEPGRVRLEGHADERGTEEYNLQLSNRRASAVKKYLSDLGVKGNRLEAVGFGENKPAVEGPSEDAWSANRRVEFRR
ncbi:MAG: OmpA family protein [Myxococcaceae bacterium]